MGVIDDEIARIDVDLDGLEQSLEELGFEVRRIRLVRVKDEIRDDDGEREATEPDED
jgi:hypothetical protein